jgi:hypothetical protein
MAALRQMPNLLLPADELVGFGAKWKELGERLSRSRPFSSGQLGVIFDKAVGDALSQLLGGIPIVTPSQTRLATVEDCVEVGPVRIIGGVRPQNFDVGYRPDGVRIAFDSKTLNDKKSLGKNWQNMVNDLATEATTVHSRFPHAVVGFMVIIPEPILVEPRKSAIIETLERLARRVGVEDPLYMAEVISLVVWNPDDGTISQTTPPRSSLLRVENFSTQLESVYRARYKGLPPHGFDEIPDDTESASE